MIITSLPAAASNSECRRRSHPDCRATVEVTPLGKSGRRCHAPALGTAQPIPAVLQPLEQREKPLCDGGHCERETLPATISQLLDATFPRYPHSTTKIDCWPPKRG